MPPVVENPEALPSVRHTGADVAAKEPPDLRQLRWLVFVYIALWVFEGALRKWVVPSMANVLLVVRDPVLLLMYALAYSKGVFPKTFFISWIAGLGLLATLLSLGTTDTPILVTAFGLRAGYLHVPLIFLLPEILRRADMRLIGMGFLFTSAFMGALVVLQFRSSAGSFLNAGAGENTTMLESALGHVRPSGTFSYTNGLTSFTALTASFFLQNLLEKRVYPRLAFLAAAPGLMIMVLLSGSRSAAAIIAIILLTVLLISLVQGRYRASSLKLAALMGVAVLVAGSISVFQSGLQVFSTRFKSNNVEQSGLSGRYLDAFAQPFHAAEHAEWNGVGLGMGTNVAAGLLTGQRKFMVAEGEGGRVVAESGPVVGMAYLMLRLCITVYIGAQAVRALRLHAATLPLLLFSGCFNDLLVGQFSQATSLGYATITGGLCLAASRTAGEPLEEKPAEEKEPVAAAKPLPVGRASNLPTRQPVVPVEPPSAPVSPKQAPKEPVQRGRSPYAARLHQPNTDEPQP